MLHLKIGMEINESGQKAEFNFAVNYLNRLDRAFSAADASAYSRDAYSWFNALLIIYRELSTEITLEESKVFDNRILKLNNDVMSSYAADPPRFSATLFYELHRFEIDMRAITKKAGLQMKMTDDARSALR